MNSRNRKHHGDLLAQRNLLPKSYFDMFWRRKWWALPPAIIGTVLTALYSFSLPPIYRSSTLILVEPQEVPSSYVSPTITTHVQERLNTIRQQIMSRTNLERIIRTFDLYQGEKQGSPEQKGFVEHLKTRALEILTPSHIQKPSALASPKQGNIPDVLVEGMREHVEVELVGKGKNNAFTIAYRGKDPYTVMRVTNALTSLFIEENLRVRERMAEGTSEFLESQLQEAKRELEQQEKALKDFKERHMGALPDQIETNLKKLDRLQIELQAVNEAIKNAEEKRILYARQFESSKAMLALGASGGSASETNLELSDTPVSSPLSEGAKLEQLRQELARLQAQFTDHYPDIILVKKQIGELETQNHAKSPSSVSFPKKSPRSSLKQMQEVQYTLLQSEHDSMLQTIDVELLSLRKKQVEIRSLIDEYEKRIESSYENEQRLFNLSRDYGISLNNYQELLKKRLNAKLSENLEKRQKGEQFRVIDPAQLPENPVGPHRKGIIAIGSLISVSCGIGLSMLVAYLTPSFQSPDDLRGLFEQPVLATVPRVELSRKDDLLVAVEEPDSFATEQYRILSTMLSEAYAERAQKVFAITSAIENEGKSLTSLNLALVMARDFGKKTLLLEGDLKRPSFSRYLRTEPKVGLVDILADQAGLWTSLERCHDMFVSFVTDNLAVLPAAKSVATSSALLSSQRMKDLLRKLRAQYEYILIDTPPILPLSDVKIFTEMVDGILLVVRASSTPQGAVIAAVEDLKIEKLTGFILNDVGQTQVNYYHYGYYYKKHTA